MKRLHAKFSGLLAGLLMAGAVLLVGVTASRGQAVAPDPALVELGLRMFKEQAPCRDCHGFMGDGVPDDPRMPKGVNFRVLQLTQDQIVEAVRCGRPSVGMPYYDRLSYTDKRCYGMTAEEMGALIPDEGMTLSTRQINALVAFITATFVGKGPTTFEQCVALWGEGASNCARFPKGT